MRTTAGRQARATTIALGALVLALLVFSVPGARAASIAYVEAGNVWLSSPDGTQKVQLTTTGTPDRPFLAPAQSLDGRTFAIENVDPQNFLSLRLHGFSATTGAEATNVSVLGDATILGPVRPLSADVTDSGGLHTHEASYCQGGYSGTPSIYYYCLYNPHEAWLGPSDQEWGITKPQKTSARRATYWGERLVFSDGSAIRIATGGGGAAQLGSSSVEWFALAGPAKARRADVSPSGGKIAWEVLNSDTKQGFIDVALFKDGVTSYSGEGAPPVPDFAGGCTMPTGPNPRGVSWSPDGSLIAWRDDEGVKVAGAPVLPVGAGVNTCPLSSPARLITSGAAGSGSGDGDPTSGLVLGGPSFGGADVAAILAARAPAAGPTPAPTPTSAAPGRATGRATGPKTAPLTRPLTLKVPTPAAGTVTATARIPAKTARKLRLPAVVARGSVKAKAKGTLKLRLTPTAKAKRAAKRLRGVTLTVTVTFPGGAKPVVLRVRLT